MIIAFKEDVLSVDENLLSSVLAGCALIVVDHIRIFNTTIPMVERFD